MAQQATHDSRLNLADPLMKGTLDQLKRFHLQTDPKMPTPVVFARAMRAAALAVNNRPQDHAVLVDDVNWLMRAHRELTREVLEFAGDGQRGEEAIDAWADRRAATLERSLNTLADIRASRTYDTTTLPVALREVRSLIRGGEGEPSGGGRDD